jgi:type IV pilus assembly protein PilQ
MKWMTKTSIILALVFFVMASIATVVPVKAMAAQDGIKAQTGKLAAIKSISVTGEGAATELVIVLSAPATFTSYKTTAPLRLVIDLSQASQGVITSPQVINKGNFKTVTANRFDTDAGVLTRIDVELDKDVEAVISASPTTPGELRVSFPSIISKPVATPVIVSIPSTEPVKVIQSPATSQAVATSSSSQVSTPIRKLTSISVNSNKIDLAVDGGVADFNSFRLNKPERLVIDLMDTQLSMPSRVIPLNTSGVASARIGLYPDKVRVVLDSVNGSFPEATTSKSVQGITVTLKIKPSDNPNTKLVATHTEKIADKTAMPAVPAPINIQAVAVPAFKMPESQKTETKAQQAVVKPESSKNPTKSVAFEPASVETIDFQVVENISRVAVRVKGDVTVEPPVKSAGFVTLTIKNTGLSKQLQRSFETRSFISPVLRITPLLVKTRKGTDTKIRIAMRVVAPFEFRQEGDMLFVDFKNPEGLTADKLPAAILDTKTQATTRASKNIISNGNAKDNELASELVPVSDSSVKSIDTGRGYKGRKVTLEFADAEVRKIFQLLSEVSNKNLVLGDDVTGNISIKLVNVPWDQALDIILDTKGLDKREDGNIIIIKGRGKFKTQAEEEQELKKAIIKSIELKAEVFNINYADVGSIATQLFSLKTDRGTIVQDSRTNKIIAKDIPQVLDDMRRLINQLDVPEKQVMIEARIVEASSTFSQSFGINWGIHAKDSIGNVMGIKDFNMGFGGLASTPPPASGVSGTPGGTMGISFGSIFGAGVNLDMRLNAAASAGLIKIISTPKVATLNNKSAKITQGQNVPYQATSLNGTDTKFVEAALSLEVTPHINANGTIGMKIDAKNDSVGDATGGSLAPAINKKQATTEMLLRDGETTVIGGIFVDSDNDADSGVPYLKDIPLLGLLFKSTTKTKVKTELLIFITPRILNTN